MLKPWRIIILQIGRCWISLQLFIVIWRESAAFGRNLSTLSDRAQRYIPGVPVASGLPPSCNLAPVYTFKLWDYCLMTEIYGPSDSSLEVVLIQSARSHGSVI